MKPLRILGRRPSPMIRTIWPIRPEGALVYTIFAPESLCQLEEIGFEPRLCRLYAPFHGIWGIHLELAPIGRFFFYGLSSGFGEFARGYQDMEDLTGNVPLQAADDLLL